MEEVEARSSRRAIPPALDDPAGARGSRATWSPRSPRCTPWTGRPRARGLRQADRLPASASCAASTASGRSTRRASCRASSRSPTGSRANLPDSPEATIVHGDYRLGNTMVADDAPARAGLDLRLGARHDRRPARGRGLPDRHLDRARRPLGHHVQRALCGDPPGGLPHARRADRALRGGHRALGLEPALVPDARALEGRRVHGGQLQALARRHDRRPLPGLFDEGVPALAEAAWTAANAPAPGS